MMGGRGEMEGQARWQEQAACWPHCSHSGNREQIGVRADNKASRSNAQDSLSPVRLSYKTFHSLPKE